jgi:hypothetical protein
MGDVTCPPYIDNKNLELIPAVKFVCLSIYLTKNTDCHKNLSQRQIVCLRRSSPKVPISSPILAKPEFSALILVKFSSANSRKFFQR